MGEVYLSPNENQTIEAYGRLAISWAQQHNQPGFWKDQMDIFQKLLPSPATVLEIGVGGGRDAVELVKRRYHYTGIDVVESFVGLTRQRLPQPAMVLHGTLGDLWGTCLKQPFQGFWCSASLLHVPKHVIDSDLKDIRRAVEHGAIGFISLKKGVGQKIEQDTLDGREFCRFFAYWQTDEFVARLERASFKVVRQSEMVIGQTTWLCFFVSAV